MMKLTSFLQVQVRIAQDTVIQTDSIVMEDVPKVGVYHHYHVTQSG